jgi:mannose-6-phosphate isomerase-like protein (cupin superfamily)
MKHIKTGTTRSFFKVVASTRSSQAAMMVLPPGESSEEFGNEHPQSEQWLFVVSGSGRARVEKRRLAIKENSLLLIEKGEKHQITNTGRRPLVTVNFYVPPAYTKDGELLPFFLPMPPPAR